MNTQRYYIAPDTEYDSGCYCVLDSQSKNEFGETRVVLSYCPEGQAKAECDRLNRQEGEHRG